MQRGFDVVSNGTDNHMFLLSLIKQNMTGKQADAILNSVNITVNKNTVPNDPQSPFVTSGIRIGTPAVTSRNFDENDCTQLAGWICDVLLSPEDESVVARVKDSVATLTAARPVYTK
jgi:glycine hydroxymethyltransferase